MPDRKTIPTRKIVVSLDTYLSILAVVSSFCAIGITFYQAYLQRTQQYASVMPVLDVYHTSQFEDGTLGSAIAIDNQGLGPAFVDSVHYYCGQKTYPDMSKLTQAVLAKGNLTDTTLLFSDLWKDRVIPTGNKLYLYQTVNRPAARQLYREDESIRVVVYYRSIYGERWMVDSRNVQEGRNRKID